MKKLQSSFHRDVFAGREVILEAEGQAVLYTNQISYSKLST